MSKMSELSMLLDDLISCGEKLTETARSLKDFYSSDEQPAAAPEKPRKTATKEKTAPAPVEEAPAAEPATPKKSLSKEDVRALLAGKAAESDGAYKAQVRDLVKKYGNGGSLTDVDPKDYAALAAEVEAIGNAG